MADLSDRAKQRLRLLAGLLRGQGQKLDMPRDQFYGQIQAVASSLPSGQQERLKSLVDWLEGYERVELAQRDVSFNDGRRAPRAKP